MSEFDGLPLSAEEDAEVLEEDTRLSKEIDNMYLTFVVGNEVYGLDLTHVIQIINMHPITTLPEMDYYTKGIIQFRGGVIPVASLRLRFNEPESEYDDRTCIIVSQLGSKRIGLIVDQIQETLTIEPEDILPPPGSSENRSPSYIKGVAKIKKDGSIKILLNIERLFAGSEFNVDQYADQFEQN